MKDGRPAKRGVSTALCWEVVTDTERERSCADGAEMWVVFFFFQAEDGIRDYKVTGVQTCALPIYVMTRETAELKTIVAVPADQDPLVDAFAQEPLNVHVAAPKAKNPEAAMLTLPLMVFAPAAPPEIPPAMLGARPATVTAKAPVARTAPALTVRVPDTSTSPVCVTVPAAEIVRLLN